MSESKALKAIVIPLVIAVAGCLVLVLFCVLALKYLPAQLASVSATEPVVTTEQPDTSVLASSTPWPTPVTGKQVPEVTPGVAGLYVAEPSNTDYTSLDSFAVWQSVLRAMQLADITAPDVSKLSVGKIGRWVVLFTIEGKNFYLDPEGYLHQDDTDYLVNFGFRFETRMPKSYEGAALIYGQNIILFITNGAPCEKGLLTTAKDRISAVILMDPISLGELIARIEKATGKDVLACTIR